MKLLLPGGTAEAQALARGLQPRGIEVIYSIAGLVRAPRLDCRVLSGGFSALGGMAAFIETEAIDAVLDATHPYAQRISETARAATRELGIPLWRYQRPPWQASGGDDWREFDRWADLPPLLRDRRSVFFTAGQLDASVLERLPKAGQAQLLRTATRPAHDLPASMTWIEAIGPFDLDAERALFALHGIDALVSKNSGGEATAAKLVVARENGVPVFLLRRPALPAADAEFDTVQACLDFVAARHGEVA